MSRRGRGAGRFAAAAAICAGLAAAATGGAPDGDAERYGALREVVVATEPLPAGRPLRRAVAAEALEVRRIPASFVAPDALASPAQALGRAPGDARSPRAATCSARSSRPATRAAPRSARRG